MFELFDLGFDVLHVRRPLHGPDTRFSSGFIHHVDGLVRQEAGGDVAVGEFDAGLDGVGFEFGFVVFLVLRLEPVEDHNGVFHGRRLDLDGLETALEGGVLFDVLAVLVEGGRAHDLHFAAAQGGLENVRGIHGALGGTGADNRVQLIDEQNDVLRFPDLVHHRLDAFLELTPVLGTGHHEGEIQGDHALGGEQFGHIALGDFLGEAFDDGGLAHARFAQQHRIVFGPATQNLNDSLNLRLTPDDRIHLSLAGEFGQISTESFQGWRLDGFLAVFGLAGLDLFIGRFTGGTGGFFAFVLLKSGIEFLQDLLAAGFDIDVEILQHLGGDAVAFAQQTEENMFRTDVGVIERLGLAGGQGQDLLHPRRVGDIAADLALSAIAADFLLHFLTHVLEVEPHALEDIDRHSLAQLDQA